MRHIIHVRADDAVCKPSRELRLAIRHAARLTLRFERVLEPSLITVTVLDELAMARLNLQMRGVAKPTDVLSFPNLGMVADGGMTSAVDALDLETGCIDLGDVALCLPIITRQAVENEQSLARELSYMTVHSVLHLLGYDHVDEGAGKRRMRAREKAVMAALGEL